MEGRKGGQGGKGGHRCLNVFNEECNSLKTLFLSMKTYRHCVATDVVLQPYHEFVCDARARSLIHSFVSILSMRPLMFSVLTRFVKSIVLPYNLISRPGVVTGSSGFKSAGTFEVIKV